MQVFVSLAFNDLDVTLMALGSKKTAYSSLQLYAPFNDQGGTVEEW